MTPYHDRISKEVRRGGGRGTHESLVQHYAFGLVPHWKVLASLAQVVEPA